MLREPLLRASGPTPSEAARPRRLHVPVSSDPLLMVMGAGLVIGAALLTISFSDFAHASTSTGEGPFDLFWIGILAFVVPAAARLCTARPSGAERLAIVAAVGAYLSLPKYLRDPGTPIFQDELAHWREANTVVATGHIYEPSSIIPIIRYFPGLHVLDASLAMVSGASTWHVAVAIVVAVHTASLLGVALIATRVIGSVRAGALAAFVYALNPSFMYFDTQFSYETLGIVFLIWVLAAMLSMAAPEVPDRVRCGWFALAAGLSAACVVTHHLTSYTLAVMLVVLAVVTRRRARAGDVAPLVARLTTVLAVAEPVAAILWAAGVTRAAVVEYLAPDIGAGIGQVLEIFTGSSGHRTLFSGSLAPGYERALAFAAPVVALAVTAGGAWLVRTGRARLASPGTALSGLAALYFASLPFDLSARGNEAARRSWAFTYLGLAVLAALAIGHLLRVRRSRARRRDRHVLSGVLVLGLLALLIGNATAAVDVEYRFPGAYLYGSDTRSITPELLAVSSWMDHDVGTGVGVVTDRYTGEALGAFAGEDLAIASPGFPTWQLLFDPGPPSARLLEELYYGHFDWLVVDERAALYTPQVGIYVSPVEPGADDHTRPLPVTALTKWDHMQGAMPVLRTTNYVVYHLDLPLMITDALRAQRPAAVPVAQAHGPTAAPTLADVRLGSGR